MVFFSFIILGNLFLVAERVTLSEHLAKAIFPEIRETDSRLVELSELERILPKMGSHRVTGSFGFHSIWKEYEENPSVKIHWDKEQTIDAVAIVPARLEVNHRQELDYGLPKSIRLSVRRNPGFMEIAKLDSTEVERREGEPIFLRFEPVTVQQLRIDVEGLGLRRSDGCSAFALAEVFVFSGEMNVAPFGKVRSPRISYESFMGWGAKHLVDGQTPLGLPMNADSDIVRGYHSDSGVDPTEDLVVELNLKEVNEIDAVRLYPAEMWLPIAPIGIGFPLRFLLQTKVNGRWRTEFSWVERNLEILEIAQ